MGVRRKIKEEDCLLILSIMKKNYAIMIHQNSNLGRKGSIINLYNNDLFFFFQ
ncbi:hypothetical protein Bache_2891 [Bacteroides helcogenes P 36-108]|uniref:Uncharacterized protein n=1 Tax=Bacteroides helcogenes (strain ATCC 35417 / DSM 20613 / JCM 6297 / CCUG 15421 / P 36-108) TaxID=693979 RepID=E6SNU3_BACT6|nr:hypothetical protein Bache_2891 [Bacteroides helcogenes P 36-108]